MSGAIAGLLCGTFVMTACMLLWNYIITPVYMKTPREVVAGMLLPVFLPFNLIKAVLNTAFTLMLYKPLTMILRKTHVLPESGSKHAVKKLDTVLVYVFAALLVGTSILAILVVSGKITL